MRYDDFRRSDNIEDRRDEDGSGGGPNFPMGGGGGGSRIGLGVIVVALLGSYFFGIDPRVIIGGAEILQGGGGQMQSQSAAGRGSSTGRRGVPSDEMGNMVSGVLGELEDRWKEMFDASGKSFEPARLVIFSGATNGGRCGMAQSAMGPFYCPPEKKIYLDLAFFKEVETRFRGCSGSACKFTAAYIIAHEYGHHIQNLVGTIPRVTQMQQQVGSRAAGNALQVKVELEADCLSGVWVNLEKRKRPNFLEPGDIDSALTTANAIGDDTLQRAATGRVVPDSFTHGTAEQRKRWFMIGYQQGSVQACHKTFSGEPL